MTGRLTLLGTGTSFGIPVIGCDCSVCTSPDTRDRRTRVAAVVDYDQGPTVLIDTPPEIRMQLVDASIGTIDAVLYTHEHADHVHGIDDLRAVSARRGVLPLYAAPATAEILHQRFNYIFDPAVRPPPGSSKPELATVAIEPWESFDIDGVSVLPLPFNHGHTQVLGFRFGPVAYLTDVKSVTAEAVERLRGVEVLVVNALFEKPHAAHLSIPEAIAVADAIGPTRTILTHLTHRYAHAALAERLPDGVEPGYDGLTVAF